MPGLKGTDLRQPAQLKRLSGSQGPGGDVQGYPVFPLVDAGAAEMIGMVVGDNQGIHLPDVPAQGGQSLFRLDSADTGVK